MLTSFTWQEQGEAAKDEQGWTLVAAVNPNREQCMIGGGRGGRDWVEDSDRV